MKKLKKTLLIISLSALASCGSSSLPDAPEIEQGAPIYGTDANGVMFVKYFHLVNSKNHVETNLSVAQGRERILFITDLESYNRSELYVAELERLAKKRCE